MAAQPPKKKEWNSGKIANIPCHHCLLFQENSTADFIKVLGGTASLQKEEASVSAGELFLLKKLSTFDFIHRILEQVMYEYAFLQLSYTFPGQTCAS